MSDTKINEVEEFEKWQRRVNGKYADRCLAKDIDGKYTVYQTYMDWSVWQACWAVCNRKEVK